MRGTLRGTAEHCVEAGSFIEAGSRTTVWKQWQWYVIGCMISVLWILFFFGPFHKSKENPRVKINIKPFIKDSHLIVFDKHIHHWLIYTLVLVAAAALNKYKPLNVLKVLQGFCFLMVLHGLSYKDRFYFSG